MIVLEIHVNMVYVWMVSTLLHVIVVILDLQELYATKILMIVLEIPAVMEHVLMLLMDSHVTVLTLDILDLPVIKI